MANGELAEAVAITPKEVLVNGKAPGETNLVIWQQGGNRLFYDTHGAAKPGPDRRRAPELATSYPARTSVNFENDTVLLTGTVKDLTSADRAVAIAATLGKVVNLLHVTVPPVEAQILLKVRFANVDRKATLDLGAEHLQHRRAQYNRSDQYGQFSPVPGSVECRQRNAVTSPSPKRDAGAQRSEPGCHYQGSAGREACWRSWPRPNVLAINGKPASFVAGGEFPYPTLQGGGAGLGAVTIQFREFGIRLQFLPTVTPRGTIRLQVMPEVSSLDFAHGLTSRASTSRRCPRAASRPKSNWRAGRVSPSPACWTTGSPKP